MREHHVKTIVFSYARMKIHMREGKPTHHSDEGSKVTTPYFCFLLGLSDFSSQARRIGSQKTVILAGTFLIFLDFCA